MGGAIFVVFLAIIAAFLIGLSIVNDKEYGNDKAIRASPVTTTEYYIGKSLFPLLVMVIYPVIAAKSIAMVLMLAILGGALLPDNWQWVVYWVPAYWYYDRVEEVFTLQATWSSVAWKSAVMVGIAGIYFLAMRRRFAKGLSS